ncbi:UNVERIFIED_CONTAM: hypothetical protein K2H54_026944 [Gekko kuhli]
MGEKSHTCPYCGKGFRRSSHLTRHLAIHSGLQRPLGGKRLGQQVPEEDRPYTCNYCGKSFARSAHLARHQETHSGERPYKCTYCGKAFGRNSHLTRHHSTHTGERPYECGVCGKAFTRSAHVTRHQGTHTGERPFRCARCGKRFTRSAHLQRHQGIHSGDKPFSCGDCGKGFTRNAHLERHRATHSGEKPFKCASCGKGFGAASHLVRHQRTHKVMKMANGSVLICLGAKGSVSNLFPQGSDVHWIISTIQIHSAFELCSEQEMCDMNCEDMVKNMATPEYYHMTVMEGNVETDLDDLFSDCFAISYKAGSSLRIKNLYCPQMPFSCAREVSLVTVLALLFRPHLTPFTMETSAMEC